MMDFIQVFIVKTVFLVTAFFITLFGIGENTISKEQYAPAKEKTILSEENYTKQETLADIRPLTEPERAAEKEKTSTMTENKIPVPPIEKKSLGNDKGMTLPQTPSLPLPENKLPKENVATHANISQKQYIEPRVLNETVRKAVVNIFCLSRSGGFFEPLSGSGVIIDERGVILTNAHVAQYFLLKDYRSPGYIDCVIRTESPANPMYRALLLFIPEVWVEKNAQNIRLQNPEGSGEHDYALLLITQSIDKNILLPLSFLALAPIPYGTILQKEEPVFAASYPAGFIGGIEITKDLWLSTSISKVRNLFTFKDEPTLDLDLFEIHGTIAAQEGSSGGAVVDFEHGNLLGIIATRTEGGTTDDRSLRILHIDHIERSMKLHTGKGLKEFLEGDLMSIAKNFASTTAPPLIKKLEETLDK